MSKIVKFKISRTLVLPNTKLSGLKSCPYGPDRTESIVPGSRSTRTALGTYFPPGESISFDIRPAKYTCRAECMLMKKAFTPVTRQNNRMQLSVSQ